MVNGRLRQKEELWVVYIDSDHCVISVFNVVFMMVFVLHFLILEQIWLYCIVCLHSTLSNPPGKLLERRVLNPGHSDPGSCSSCMLGHRYMKCNSWCSNVTDFGMSSLTVSLPFSLKTPDLWKINQIWLAFTNSHWHTYIPWQHLNTKRNIFLLPTKSCILY
jgi:hypothetical protein